MSPALLAQIGSLTETLLPRGIDKSGDSSSDSGGRNLGPAPGGGIDESGTTAATPAVAVRSGPADNEATAHPPRRREPGWPRHRHA